MDSAHINYINIFYNNNIKIIKIVNIIKIYLIIIILSKSEILIAQISNVSMDSLMDCQIAYFDNYKNTKADSISKILVEKNNLRNPLTAIGISVFPGSIVHGLGHWYIGHKKGFWLLFSLESISVLSIPMYIASTGWDSESNNFDTFVNSFYFIFFSTWAYDIIASPIVCARDNKRKREMLSIHPYINHCQFGNQIGLKLVYHF